MLPIEVSSGVDRDGRARSPRRFVMSRRGNDLVRRYLGMAALRPQEPARAGSSAMRAGNGRVIVPTVRHHSHGP